MDISWYRHPSKAEVIGRCGGNEKKTNDHAEPTKSRTLKKTKTQKHKKHIKLTLMFQK